MSARPAFDLLVAGGTVVLPDRELRADVGVRDGRVVALLAPGTVASAVETFDATGKHVLPGAIDIHFHVRAPAYPERGTVETETRAAAAAGVTTLLEMPISKPCCATPEVFRARRDHFASRAHVNFGLYGAPGRLVAAEVQGMADEGAVAFKVFTTSAPKGRDDEFIGLCLPETPGQYQALQLVKETGRVLSVHAENEGLIVHLTKQLIDQGRNDPPAHYESRPPFVEATAVASLLAMNRGVGARMHIAHVTSRQALDVVRAFQMLGDDVTAETCPQYLRFDQSALARHGAYAKINPPLRDADDISALWEAIEDGTIGYVTTDHSPFTVAEKEKAKTDLWAAPPGAPGIETLVVGMLDAVAAGRVSIVEAARLISTNGAERFGLRGKGIVAPGADADLTIVDLNATTTIDARTLRSAARDIDRLHDGLTFRGRVAATVLAGRVVFDGVDVLSRPGEGTFVRPS